MDLLTSISTISSFATLHTWISEKSLKNTDKIKFQNLNHIDLEMKKEIEKWFNQESNIVVLDQFITKHSAEFKEFGISMLFSEEEKQKAIENFTKSNPSINAILAEKVLREYFIKLNTYLNENLSLEVKLVKRWISESENKIITAIDEKLSDNNVYHNSSYSKKIIGLCSSIHAIFLSSDLKINFLNKTFSADYLTAENLENVFLKISNLFKFINTDEINIKTNIKTEISLESLLNLATYVSLDLSVELKDYYRRVMPQTITCIEEFSGKTKNYYISVGALGLISDSSDEKIYNVVMNNLVEFLFKVHGILKSCSEVKDYKALEDKTINEMNKHIFNRIKWYFTKETKDILNIIFERERIIDTELANELGIDISYLRKLLNIAKQDLVLYKFYNNFSTIIFINSKYKETIMLYYKELFEEQCHEV